MLIQRHICIIHYFLGYFFFAGFFEEWLRSVLHALKSLELLECRNGLYMLYMERVTGELAKWLRPLSRQGKLSLDILSSFLR